MPTDNSKSRSPQAPKRIQRKRATQAEVFAALVLRSQVPESGGLDGFDLEGMAIKAGLYQPIIVTKSCAKGEDGGCACAEYGFPATCNRLSKAAKRLLEIANAD